MARSKNVYRQIQAAAIGRETVCHGDQPDHGRTAKAPHGCQQSFSNAPGAARLREVARRGSRGRDIYLLLKVERDVDETQRGIESARAENQKAGASDGDREKTAGRVGGDSRS